MEAQTDWQAWHGAYADERSPLSRRLRIIQHEIMAWLDRRPGERLAVVSLCAGQGHDQLEVLGAREDAPRVRATLLESDERNIAFARAAADAAGAHDVTVISADAGQLASYVEVVPADLLLVAGVFGNISDADVMRTIRALPRLCAGRATVIWTRTRRSPDLTPSIREWFGSAGFAEVAFHAPNDVLFAVGVNQLITAPQPLTGPDELFRFVR